MLLSFLRRFREYIVRPAADPATERLYRACLLQARHPAFFGRCGHGVPDTLDGRFDLLVLHVCLVMRAMGDEAVAKQKLFDRMFADMDRSLREMGVGDMGIGRRMKAMIAAFYGRAQAYDAALAGRGDTLAECLRRNLYGGGAADQDMIASMVDYALCAAARLLVQPRAELLAGAPDFGMPPLLTDATYNNRTNDMEKHAHEQACT